MADELTREEVSDRLVAIFSASLEGSELEKAISSVDKRLDKFEGKWAGLIKWAEQKYGIPEESATTEETEETPEEVQSETVQETHEESAEEVHDDAEMTREDASGRLEAIFRSNLEGKELDKMRGSIDKRLDKFEGKWPKLILWAEEKYGTASEISEQAETGNEDLTESPGMEETLELIISGNSEAALSNLKKLVSSNPSDPDIWNAFSSYFSSVGKTGRANACEERAKSLA
tara:strand:- start:353 stop:1048 length:696 start_codon:yes stop_codon:yes gene_type:complete